MKFRTSFQVSREPREDGSPTTTSSMPFKVPSLRKKDSKAAFAKEREEQLNTVRLEEKKEDGDVQMPASRKQAMQDFFKSTGANLKATSANLRATTARIPKRMPTRKTKARVAHSPSKRNSRAPQSFDIKDDVLDRLLGPKKSPVQGKIQSDEFFLKQKIRASSRAASANNVSPLSGRSQAEHDRKPLSAEEVNDMFVGAPYFNVQSLGKKKDGFRPQVIFRGWDVEESAKYGRDYAPLGHLAFEACTLGLHRTRRVGERPVSWSLEKGSRVATDRDLLEVPSMLSANGQDAGTIGFEHFLELPVADSGILPEEPSLFDKRKLLLSEPEQLGLREMNMEILIDRLTELGELHASDSEQSWSEEKIAEMGEDLFGRVLDAELGTTSAGTGCVTLKTQVMALQKVLSEVELWWDFSQVEWRIRVGQLLWASHEDDTPQLDEHRQPSERDILLLQITLAAELAVRLDAVKTLMAGGSTFPPPIMSTEERENIESERTRKVQWDLLLAERFLENLKISAKVPSASKANKRSSFFSAITFLTAKETPEETEQGVQPLLFPKQQERQLAGLMFFAEALQWPHAKDMQTELEAKLSLSAKEHDEESSELSSGINRHSQRPVSGISMYATPLSSPLLPGYTPSANRQSYFGGSTHSKRPGPSRMTTAQSMQLLPAITETSENSGDTFQGLGGWLSRSWLAGLVLPGEPSSHFLISTLLENSPQAIEALGDSANLYGGFVYDGRSFWSASCVVGRVLGAVAGAKECMGWISVPEVANQRNLEDGWVDLDVKDLPSVVTANNSSSGDREANVPIPRIKDAGAVARVSDPLHGSTMSGVQAGDFMLPIDGPPVMGNEVRFLGLSFQGAPVTDLPETEITTSANVAYLTFASPINSRLSKLEVPLTYDVHFISSYPCHPQAAPNGRGKSRAGSKVASPVAGTSNKDEDVAREGTQATSSPAQLDVPPLEASPHPLPLPDSVPAVQETNEASHQVPTNAPPPPPGAAAQLPTDSARASATTSLPNLPLDPKKNATTTTLEKALPRPPAHPLHIDFHFDTLPVATLLTAPDSTNPTTSRPRALSSPKDRQQLPVNAEDDEDEVVVLDCRGAEDLELLARAWCAKVGENALVGKTGRTCLACCVREARGLGVKVVIRI